MPHSLGCRAACSQRAGPFFSSKKISVSSLSLVFQKQFKFMLEKFKVKAGVQEVEKKENAVAVKIQCKVYHSLSAEYCDIFKNPYFRTCFRPKTPPIPAYGGLILDYRSDTDFDSFLHLCLSLSVEDCKKPFGDYKVCMVY